MTTREFIDQLAAGESAAAKETLENLISNRAFEALDEYKKQMAAGIFSGDKKEEQTEVEVQDAE
jgi:hypothetical protein